MTWVQPEGYTLDRALRAVGRGWHQILQELWTAKPDTVRVVQVKEKFGLLRVYADPEDGVPWSAPEVQAFEKATQEAEYQSSRTCQNCGTPGSLKANRRWLKTLCHQCKEVEYDHAIEGGTK